MHDHPLRLEARRQIDIGAQILIGGIAQERRDLRNVDGGQGMEAEVQAVALAGFGDARAALIIEALHGIGRDVGLGIEIVDAMAGRPGDAVLERDAAAEVNADPILEGHRIRPSSRQAKLGVASVQRRPLARFLRAPGPAWGPAAPSYGGARPKSLAHPYGTGMARWL